MKISNKLLALSLILTIFLLPFQAELTKAAEESGSVGIEGKISAPPPTQAATISFPNDGTTTTESTITISGLCPNGLIVKIYKNNVFAGAVQCNNGSFTIQIDLFSGRNEIVARVFDDLDQQGPDSNVVVVNFPVNSETFANRISLSSTFAKKGANPGEQLIWPIILSGGTGPYAITVNWGDGKTPDVLSQEFPGTFNINHVYDSPGIYTIIIRAADKNGNIALLQLIGVGNGEVSPVSSTGENNGASGQVRTKILWQPAVVLIPLVGVAFWLGSKHQIYALRKRLEKP
ncbi:PKD domain-containing protein [Candidatus Saccharibacteria bacterium]|nr:PKD domain-containing protein [Candidatus Saccharibacteria bacterium]